MNYNKYIDRLTSTHRLYHDQNISSSQDSDTILNDIIQHPFIDTLPMDISFLTDSNCPNNTVKYNVILYRIQHHNDYHYVEFYLPSRTSQESLFNIEYHNTTETLDKNISNTNIIKYLKQHIQYIPGVKRYKGHILHNNIIYTIVQVRDNRVTDISNNRMYNPPYYINNNWLTLWDIITYKHVFREKIDNNIVELFVKHHTIAHLFLKKQICLLPMTLYCTVLNKYNTFIHKTKSVQYCQRENSPIVYLSYDYLCETNNVRNVCFIQDPDIYTTMETLQNQSCIILKNEHGLNYLFKNDDNILSYIK
jgi:hypothetical protein